MTNRMALTLTALALIAALPIPGHVAAQPQTDSPYPYIAINTGTLGGPASGYLGYGGIPLINNSGTAFIDPDTAITDTDLAQVNPIFGPNFPGDLSIQHAAIWHHGELTDLGALPGTNNSVTQAINARGDAVGESEITTLDPLEGFTEIRAVPSSSNASSVRRRWRMTN